MSIPQVVLNIYALCIAAALICIVIINKRTEKNAFIADIKHVNVFDISVVTNHNIATQTFYLALIELANKGYLTIEENDEEGLIFTKLKDFPEDTDCCIDELFDGEKRIALLNVPDTYFKKVREECFNKARYYSDMWFKSSPLMVKIMTPFIVLLPVMTMYMLEIIKQTSTKNMTTYMRFLTIVFFIAVGVMMTSSLSSPVSAFFEEKIQTTKFQTICHTGVLVLTLISVVVFFQEPMVFAFIVDLGYLLTLRLIKEMQAYNYLGLSYEHYCKQLPKAKKFEDYFLECYCTGKMDLVENKFKDKNIKDRHGFHAKDKKVKGVDDYETYFFNILEIMELAEKKAVSTRAETKL